MQAIAAPDSSPIDGLLVRKSSVGNGMLREFAVADVAEEVVLEEATHVVDRPKADGYDDMDERSLRGSRSDCTGKRARDRLKKKRARLYKAECQDYSETVADDMGDWRQLYDGVGYLWRFMPEQLYDARCYYKDVHGLCRGTCSNDQVEDSSAVIGGWSEFDPSALIKVGQDVHDGGLCGIWLLQALLAASEMP